VLSPSRRSWSIERSLQFGQMKYGTARS